MYYDFLPREPHWHGQSTSSEKPITSHCDKSMDAVFQQWDVSTSVLSHIKILIPTSHLSNRADRMHCMKKTEESVSPCGKCFYFFHRWFLKATVKVAPRVWEVKRPLISWHDGCAGILLNANIVMRISALINHWVASAFQTGPVWFSLTTVCPFGKKIKQVRSLRVELRVSFTISEKWPQK